MTAYDGCQRGTRGKEKRDHSVDVGRFRAAPVVTHDGLRDDLADGCADALQQTPAVERPQRLTEGCSDAGRGKEEHAADKGRTSAVAVGEAAGDETEKGVCEEINRERLLHGNETHAEVFCHRVKARHDAVGRKRPQARGKPERGGVADARMAGKRLSGRH